MASVARTRGSGARLASPGIRPRLAAVFVAATILPHWLADVGAIFPVRHLANALLTAYNPHTTGLGFAGTDLLIVAAWGPAGFLIAVRTFSWLPLGR